MQALVNQFHADISQLELLPKLSQILSAFEGPVDGKTKISSVSLGQHGVNDRFQPVSKQQAPVRSHQNGESNDSDTVDELLSLTDAGTDLNAPKNAHNCPSSSISKNTASLATNTSRRSKAVNVEQDGLHRGEASGTQARDTPPNSALRQMAVDLVEIKAKLDLLAGNVDGLPTKAQGLHGQRIGEGQEGVSGASGAKGGPQAVHTLTHRSNSIPINNSSFKNSRSAAPLTATAPEVVADAALLDDSPASSTSATGGRRSASRGSSRDASKRKSEHIYHPSPPMTRSGTRQTTTSPAQALQALSSGVKDREEEVTPVPDFFDTQHNSPKSPTSLVSQTKNYRHQQQKPEEDQISESDSASAPESGRRKLSNTTPSALPPTHSGDTNPSEAPTGASASNPIEFESSEEEASKRQKLNDGQYQSNRRRPPPKRQGSNPSHKKTSKKLASPRSGPLPKMYPDSKSRSHKKKKPLLRKQASHDTPCPKSRGSQTLTPTQSTLHNSLPIRSNMRESNAFSMLDKSSTPMSERPECPPRLFTSSPSPVPRPSQTETPNKDAWRKDEAEGDDLESLETDSIASLTKALSQDYEDIESYLQSDRNINLRPSAMKQTETETPRTYQTHTQRPFNATQDSLPMSPNDATGQGSFRWMSNDGESTFQQYTAVSQCGDE